MGKTKDVKFIVMSRHIIPLYLLNFTSPNILETAVLTNYNSNTTLKTNTSTDGPPTHPGHEYDY